MASYWTKWLKNNTCPSNFGSVTAPLTISRLALNEVFSNLPLAGEGEGRCLYATWLSRELMALERRARRHLKALHKMQLKRQKMRSRDKLRPSQRSKSVVQPSTWLRGWCNPMSFSDLDVKHAMVTCWNFAQVMVAFFRNSSWFCFWWVCQVTELWCHKSNNFRPDLCEIVR